MDEKYNPNYNLILDLLGSDIQVHDSEIHQLADYLNNTPTFRGKRNVGVLTDLPKQVVTVELFHLYYQQKLTKLKIASTLNTVLDWVGLSETNLDFLLDTIRELTDLSSIRQDAIVHE